MSKGRTILEMKADKTGRVSGGVKAIVQGNFELRTGIHRVTSVTFGKLLSLDSLSLPQHAPYQRSTR
jgi:hypothetical protein